MLQFIGLQRAGHNLATGNVRGVTFKIATFFFYKNNMYFCKLFKEEFIQKVI